MGHHLPAARTQFRCRPARPQCAPALGPRPRRGGTPMTRLDTPRLAVAAFLLSEAAFFGFLIAAYVYFYPASSGAARNYLDPPRTLIFTICLLASSGTMWLAERRLSADARNGFRLLLGITIALGAIFLAGQGLEYAGLISKAVTPERNLFGATCWHSRSTATGENRRDEASAPSRSTGTSSMPSGSSSSASSISRCGYEQFRVLLLRLGLETVGRRRLPGSYCSLRFPDAPALFRASRGMDGCRNAHLACTGLAARCPRRQLSLLPAHDQAHPFRSGNTCAPAHGPAPGGRTSLPAAADHSARRFMGRRHWRHGGVAHSSSVQCRARQ